MQIQAKPIIPWPGGKRRLAKQILPLFPGHECYVEPFSGAAALFFLKQPAGVEVLNDCNSDLVGLYRVVQHHLEEFVRQFRWSLTSRMMFKWLNDTPVDTLTDIQRAARFYYLQRMSFGAKVEGRTFGVSTTSRPKLNLLRIEEDLSAAHLRLAQVYIEHLDWRECVQRYDRPHTLFFCDPPYFGTEGYGVPFGIEQYGLLADMARSVRGRMLITVNDIPEMREIFAGLTMDSVEVNYTIGGGGRAAKRHELIIRSWE